MRVMLVDDEPLALRRMEILLSRIADVEVVGSCSDGETAKALAKELKPDAVMLDVVMPLIDGFGVADAIGAEDGPALVFVTAHDDFAVRAFDTRAVDYLLKPVDSARLAEALDRVRAHLSARAMQDKVAQLEAQLDGLRETVPDMARRRDFWVKDRDRVVRVPEREIEWIEAERDYVRLHVDGRSWLVRETMQRMEQELDTARFIRVHRSAIVNTDAIRMAKTTPSGARVLRLASGAEVRVGRSYESTVARLVSDAGR